MKKLLLLFVLMSTMFVLEAQVGINTESPHRLTELDIKNIINGTDTIPKGILIPRLRTEQRDQMVISDIANENGILIYNIDEDCYNYYHRTDREWKSICGKVGNAVFTIDCNKVNLYGEYKNGVETGSTNYISVIVSVTKPGLYTISATITDPLKDNGYFFHTSGEFLSIGTFTIRVPAMGTPINYSNPDKDQFTIELNAVRANGDDPACTFEVEVKNNAIRPLYTMQCSGTVVHGEYYEDEQLVATNYIEVVLNVDPTSFGATYEIETNEVDGIKFSGSGILTSNPQTVQLKGEGTPYSIDTKKMYIKSNSESSTATCIAQVYMIIPAKRILTIATNNAYGYNFGSVTTASNKMITDQLNFGPQTNSIVRYAGFKNKGTTLTSNEGADDGRTIVSRDAGYYYSAVPATQATLNTEFHNLLFGKAGYAPIDILYIGWTSGINGAASAWDNITDSQLQDIYDFVQGGGILLMFSEAPVLNNKIFRKIFNKSDIDFTAGTTTNPPGSVYRLPSITDPILDGPFGNVTGLYWGEDASTTNYVVNLPLDEVVLYSNNVNVVSGNAEIMNAATAFRHRTLPFVWVGDGGFTSNDAGTAPTICPFKLTTKTISGTTYSNYPTYKPNYGSGTITANLYKYQVHNAVFAANAIAWCIETAEANRKAQKQ